MSIYKNFSKYYDEIFPLKNQTLEFLLEHLHKGKILDLGCATGEYALGLSRKGYQVYGLDFDQEMIRLAILKAKQTSQTAHFTKRNMLELDESNQFDGIYCIGNTLVHLHSIEEICVSLQLMYNALKSDSNLIIQIINYDRILNKNIKSLPTIESSQISFQRDYMFDGEKIHFLMTLKTDSNTYQEEVLLVPIRFEELEACLKKIGFKEIKAFDGFSFFSFKLTKSNQLVLTCKK
ncbi:MAG: class I SAM-dependent methyltransferase [Firmicutes bacterium]|nr:class I SAM-dependent methyltransferase [Bacillota bacterium]